MRRVLSRGRKDQVLTPKGGKLTDPKREHEVVGKPRYATVNDFNLDADDSACRESHRATRSVQ